NKSYTLKSCLLWNVRIPLINTMLMIFFFFFFSVKVYVELNHNSPRILCLTNHLRNLELIDPIFQWTGPGENSSVKISPSGTLILRHFNQSGVYTCSIVYKLTAMQPVEHLIIKYLIYAYFDPKNYYEFTARYHTAPCNSSENTYFEKALLQILSNLVAELSCEVTLIKSECHHVKMQRGGLQNENFFTFSGKNLHFPIKDLSIPKLRHRHVVSMKISSYFFKTLKVRYLKYFKKS
uniref:Ig-like domain-containing protein n=1 Tax=Amazona collaria TaxID=241587 RepID=A0A8B9GDJ1_9PSIT